MSIIFRTIGIVGHIYHQNVLNICKNLYYWLHRKGYHVILENQIANNLTVGQAVTGNLFDIGEQADLAVVVGGDGNMLRALRILVYYDIKVVGVNCGSLGFLADLDPNIAVEQLSDMLKGNFHSEKRFLLEVQIFNGHSYNRKSNAINEVVLYSSQTSHMIEFDVYIDNIFAFSQRSNGCIITTPTGSTAYSLSAGGPILAPPVNAIALVPMFSHALSSRPLVVNGKSVIRLKFSRFSKMLEINCDSQVFLPVDKDEEILIRRSHYYLNLIHPKNYNYFNTLSIKLNWMKNISFDYE